ncbi:MAG: hypothetical protein O2887_05385 [Bacteroidetes bacterium]|nr:hypothetical protein [Bacteroidota bacterium]MDA1119914.1 hypothetical protein [Bacteroidota bacterium]
MNAIILNVESGDLEQKFLLAVKSIRLLHQNDTDIYAVNPRANKSLSSSTLELIDKLQITLIQKNINEEHRFYAFANKVYTTSYIESKYGFKYEYLIYLDSDTLLLQPIERIINDGSFEIALKPDEDFYEYGQRLEVEESWIWKWIFDGLQIVDNQRWTVLNSIRNNEIYAYFNGGLVISKASRGFFNKWKKHFITLTQAKEFFKLSGRDLFFVEQMILSACVMKEFDKQEVKILNNSCNYCLNHHNKLYHRCESLSDVKLLHYHNMFYEMKWLDQIDLDKIQYEWLLNELPLKKYQKTFKKKSLEIFQYQLYKLKHRYGLKYLI